MLLELTFAHFPLVALLFNISEFEMFYHVPQWCTISRCMKLFVYYPLFINANLGIKISK